MAALLGCAFLLAFAACGPNAYPASRSGGDYERLDDGASESTGGVPLELEDTPRPQTETLSVNMNVSDRRERAIRTSGRVPPLNAPKSLDALEPIAPADADAALAQLDRAPPQPASTSAEVAPADVARRPALIYDARLQLAVFEAEQAVDAAEHLAQENGGYLVHRGDVVITFRVPAERFQSVLASAAKLGDVLHREVSVRDVSDELRDLELRLRNATATRDRLEQLLNRAEKVQETLEVARELERVVGEIEEIKGRLKVLSELIAFSTITLQFQARSIDQVDSTVQLPFPWLEHLGLGELLRL